MRILITAGPTREPIDPVRYITNRSSGKMGYAIAEAAIAAGHEVTLVSGPVALAPPDTAATHLVETAREMHDAVADLIGNADAAVFCAAVADYRVAEASREKIKKSSDKLTLDLTENPDILGSARTKFEFTGVLVGFAAETNDVERHARDKLARKGCDIIAANDVSRKDIGFDGDENEVTLYFADGSSKVIPRSSKKDIARNLMLEIERL